MKRLLIAVVMLWPLVARAEDPCTNARFMHAFDPALTPQACKTLNHPVMYAPGQSAKVLHPGASTDPTREEAAAVTELGAILGRSAGAARQVLLPMPEKIRVFLDPNPLGPENRTAQLGDLASAIREHAAEDGECLLAYHYKDTGAMKNFMLAHELFHCIVKRAWEGARLEAGDANWWAEGSAQFFASIVYQAVGTDADEQHFAGTESTKLMSRDRDAVVFFDWYSNGPGRLKHLIDLVQEQPEGLITGDLVDEIAGNNWLRFEEDWYDKKIASPGNHPIDAAPHTPDATRISSSTTKTFRAEPYEIHGAVLEFQPGHAYELDGGTENDFHWKWSEGEGGGWEDAPRVVHTCHETKKFRIAIAAKDRGVNKTLRVTARDERESDCPCVVGSWQQTSASLARVAARLQSRGIRNASCSFVGGGTLLTFTADHNGGEAYQGLHTVCTSPTSNSEGTTNGTRAFTWADTSATQLTMTSAGGNASSHIVVTVHGHASAMDAPLTGAGAGAVTYRCTRTDLHLEYPGVNGTDSFDYTRAH